MDYSRATTARELLGPGTIGLIDGLRRAERMRQEATVGYLRLWVQGAMLAAVRADRLSIAEHVELAMNRSRLRSEIITAHQLAEATLDDGLASIRAMDEGCDAALTASLTVFRAPDPNAEDLLSLYGSALTGIRVFRAALARLRAKPRAMFLLHFEEERPLDEIADLFGLSASSVGRRLSSVTKSLRAVMLTSGFKDPPPLVDLEPFVGPISDVRPCDLSLPSHDDEEEGPVSE